MKSPKMGDIMQLMGAISTVAIIVLSEMATFSAATHMHVTLSLLDHTLLGARLLVLPPSSLPCTQPLLSRED